MATQKEVSNRISAVKNVHKITRAMEMVAAARLRRAEQRIDAMRPYAQAIRQITQQVAEADEGVIAQVPLLKDRDVLYERDEKHARKLLKAAAMTYVAASLMSLLNIARWIAILRR